MWETMYTSVHRNAVGESVSKKLEKVCASVNENAVGESERT